MNPIALYFADGTMFFVGLAMVLFSLLLLFWFKSSLAKSLFSLFVFVGCIIVILSATPLPEWLYLIWLSSVLIGLVLLRLPSATNQQKKISSAISLILTLLLCLLEIPYHCPVQLLKPRESTVYILGDSMSAGIGGKQRCWPEILEDITGTQIINLSQAGATVKDAVILAEKIPASEALVILEIGGNDLLGGTDALVFKERLENLVSTLKRQGHQILIFELPLFPFRNAYGKAQRSIAAEHDAEMLPKRYFTRVLRLQKGTLDGLHLSESGHLEMARIIADVIQQD